MHTRTIRRTFTAFLVLTLAPAVPLGARDITPEERAKLVQFLTTGRDQVLAEAEKLTDAQWNFKQGPDRWSVGEVVEHLALAEPLLFGMQQKMLQGPKATPEQLAEAKGLDDKIVQRVEDRTQKATAPEPLQPGTLGNREQVIAAFKERRANTLKYVETTKDDLRSYVAASPVFKTVDGYQWLLFLGAHNNRHLAQIREVKADPNFPKGTAE
jgi:hypothetical protein